MPDISERSFEETIEAALLAGGPDAASGSSGLREAMAEYGDYAPGGYGKRSYKHYDRDLCLDPEMVIDFVLATQPDRWDELKTRYGTDIKDSLLKRLSAEITKRGVLDVLRKGVKDYGVQVDLAYFRPATGLNPDVQTLYDGNTFTVVRQLRYSKSNESSIDTVLFLNGIPILTAELKNPLNQQRVEDAVAQYRRDRDPREPLLAFERCLAHFAVDPDNVFVTTRLEGEATRFLPFNRGKWDGAGNLPVKSGFPTHYLWDHVWARDSVLELIQRFIHTVHEEDDKGRKTGKRSLIFPRYHQLDAVRRLVADAERNGAGQRYLIQHSAGSGKSNTIAWLAHQLSGLFDASDERVFDSIVVITDRRILDRQLQRTVRQFEQTLGIVENIDQTSRQLKKALEAGKTIIVTTLQKFPVIVDQIGELAQKRFAVIIDEAHSSQSGEATSAMKKVLKSVGLEEAEKEQEAESANDLEDRIVAAAQARGPLPNLSLFAFTATPKQKTLELFGRKGDNGTPEPFSLYSMRQAIEEGFIVDVLENYTTYKTLWKLVKKIEADPKYEHAKASYLLKSWVDLHPHAISEKVAIMVEHFRSQVANRINGRAKAMIVTRSRLHAVRTKLALDAYLTEKEYPYKALVAFSDTIEDPSTGIEYSEANMNGFSERQTAAIFKQADQRFLVVAEKFQTGFDEPMLHTMYVDKRLSGVNAVQTLSRLNRVHPDKAETMVLDFVNDADDIRKAFEPYYRKTILSESTDANLLYAYQRRLLDAEIFDETEVKDFARAYFMNEGMDRLYAVLSPAKARYEDKAEEERAEFKRSLANYTRLYAFLAQIMPFSDADLESLYHFARLLDRYLGPIGSQLPVEVQKAIDIDSYRIQESFSGDIGLQGGEALPGRGDGRGQIAADELEALSEIIRELNERFGAGLSEKDRVFIEELESRLDTNAALEASVRANTPDNAKLTFKHVVEGLLEEMVDTNFDLYKRVTDDERFGEFLRGRLFDRYRERVERTANVSAPNGLINRAVELVKVVGPRKIILFGSAARGDVNAESDLDVMVIFDEVLDWNEQWMKVADALRPLHVPVDILVYSQEQVDEWGHVVGHVMNEALIDGRVVYESA